MKKMSLLVLFLLILSACSDSTNNGYREVQVVVKDVICEDGRLFSDSGCALITENEEKYLYGTDLISLREGQSVILTVKGFNKIKKMRYIENIVE